MISFAQAPAYELAETLLTQPLQDAPYVLYPDRLAVEVDDLHLRALLARIARSFPTAVLPVLGQQADAWWLVGVDRQVAARAFAQISRFLLPSYGVVPGKQAFAVYQPIPAGPAPVYRAAEVCYGGGYIWHSPPRYRSTVLQKVALWSRLDAERPPLTIARKPTYVELLQRFNSALAISDWPDAESALAEMRALHLCTADNLAFLRVQLLAQQGQWKTIWEDALYPRLASISLPRAVRSALITAFHHTVLLDAEQQGAFAEALASFKRATPKLGALLNGRFQLTDGPVLRVFGYQAVLARDGDAFAYLLGTDGLDPATRTCLEALQQFLPPKDTPPLPAAERLRRAMHDRNYDAALEAAMGLESGVARAIALLRIAYGHQDAARQAVAAYDALSPQEQELLEVEEPALNTYLERVLGYFDVPTPHIQTWEAWFQRLLSAPHDAQLVEALDYLGTQTDDRDWTPPTIRALAVHVNDAILARENIRHLRSAQRGLNLLVDTFLKDQEFPRPSDDYSELYQALYDGLILVKDVNEKSSDKLLRLADATVYAHRARLENVHADLREWFGRPTPALENVALDAFELLIEYGLPGARLMDWYRDWVLHRLELPESVPWDRTRQEVWLSLGEWIQPGDDVLLRLRQRLAMAAARRGEDPVARFPANYLMGLFTLHRSSAERVRQLLLGRNSGLDIRICQERDMNVQVEAIARHCDVAVIVTSCITHAITYGVTPLLRRAPVYPASRGSASILRAIEDHAEHIAL